MVNTRIYIAGSNKSRNLRLRARYYGTNPPFGPQGVNLPKQILIDTHQPKGPSPNLRLCRFPYPENVMRQKRRQPYIHNCRVSVYDSNTGLDYRFMVFFKRHIHLYRNDVLDTMTHQNAMRGDVVVMSIGKQYNLVNMKASEVEIVDWMMTEFCQEVIFVQRGVPRVRVYIRV